MDIGALEVVDGGDAQSLSAVLASFPSGVSRVLEETCRAIGVDAKELLGVRGSAAPRVGEVLR
jgi:hypothetical protein